MILRNIVVALILLLPLTSVAQIWPPSQGGRVEVGFADGFQYYLNIEGSENRVLEAEDSCGTVVNRISLPHLEDCDLLAASLVDGVASLLMVDSLGEGQTLIVRVRVEVGSRSFELDTLERYTYTKENHCMVWGATSPSGTKHAVVVVVQYPATLQYSARATLYDTEMETLWQKEYAMGSLSQVTVSDEGRIVTLGVESEGEEEVLVYNIIDSRRAESYSVALKCARLRYFYLAGLVGSHAMAVGTFTTTGFEGAENVTGGVTGFSFDVDSIVLSGFTQRWFQNEDVNILYNLNTRTIQREQLADFVKISGVALTPYGVAVVLSRSWREEEEIDFGNADVKYHTVGLNCAVFDTLGHIGWVRNMRRNAISSDMDKLAIDFGYSDGMLNLAVEERRNDPKYFNIERPVKKTKMPGKNRRVVYRISDDGKIDKLIR